MGAVWEWTSHAPCLILGKETSDLSLHLSIFLVGCGRFLKLLGDTRGSLGQVRGVIGGAGWAGSGELGALGPGGLGAWGAGAWGARGLGAWPGPSARRPCLLGTPSRRTAPQPTREPMQINLKTVFRALIFGVPRSEKPRKVLLVVLQMRGCAQMVLQMRGCKTRERCS